MEGGRYSRTGAYEKEKYCRKLYAFYALYYKKEM